MEAARGNRHGHRDAAMTLMAYRQGFRAAELVNLSWDQIDFRGAVLHARRIKNGMPSTHPILGDELRALRRLQRESEASPFVLKVRDSAVVVPLGVPGAVAIGFPRIEPDRLAC
jgi:integrase